MIFLEMGSTVFAGASYCLDWGTSNRITKNMVRGVQAFSVVNLIDRLARLSLPSNATAAPAPVIGGLISAVLEEIAYAGILTSQKITLLPLRMGISLAVGMTATRDVKIGIIYSVVRESIVQLTPEKFSMPLLVTADSFLFTLIEVKSLPPEALTYKTISSFFFRIIANTVSYETGIGASLIQHALFNLSRSNTLR